jgi:hypothetical protein
MAGQKSVVVPPAPCQVYSHLVADYPSDMPVFAAGYPEPRIWRGATSLQWDQVQAAMVVPQQLGPQGMPGFYYVTSEPLMQKAPGVGL